MFVVNEDMSISVTRGDAVKFPVSYADKSYVFQAGDVVRFKVYGKKNAENVVLQKDFPVTEECTEIEISLTSRDTKIGEVISKPTVYWYEVELNPFDNPDTFIGYGEDGAKLFTLYPEGADVVEDEVTEEDIPIVDTTLDMTSTRPVQNQAIARGLAALKGEVAKAREATNEAYGDIAVEKARIDNLVSGATANDAELIDIRIGAYGELYNSAGTAVREQILMARKVAKDLRSEFYTESNRNIIHPVGIVKKNGSEGLSAYLTLEGKVVFNGTASEPTAFELIVESNAIPENDGDFYFVMDKSEIIKDTGLTWGIAPTYTDGTSESTVYSNNNHFFPLTAGGKTISKIKIVFGEGHSFTNTEVLFYTSYFDGKFDGYEPHYLTKSALHGQKWASLGDSLTENTGNSGELWQNQVANHFGLVPIVCGKGGSTTGGFIDDDVYSLIPSDVDIISVMGGTNDCSQELPIYVEGDEYYFNSGHYTGAIRRLIRKLQTDFPKAKIVFCNCLSARLNEVGKEQELPYRNDIGLTMADYAAKCIEVCREMGIPCIDLCGESGINTWNAASYMADNVHPNSEGYKKIADVYIRNFKRFLE